MAALPPVQSKKCVPTAEPIMEAYWVMISLWISMMLTTIGKNAAAAKKSTARRHTTVVPLPAQGKKCVPTAAPLMETLWDMISLWISMMQTIIGRSAADVKKLMARKRTMAAPLLAQSKKSVRNVMLLTEIL